MTGALGRMLDHALAREGQVLDGDSTAFTSLRAQAAAIGQALTAHGLTPNEPVHVGVGNRAADLAALLGVWLAGGVAVPVHIASAPATLARVHGLTTARFMVDAGRVSEIAGAPPPYRPLLHDAALVVLTSGTTGLPKGVVLGHDRFAAKLDVLGGMLRFRPSDHVVAPLQLTFVFGMWVSLLAIRAGARLTLMPRFSLAALSGSLDGATVLAAVPSTLRAMLAEDRLTGPGPRLLLAGGEALGAPLRNAVRQRWPSTDLHDLYGLTETGSCDFCLTSAGGEAGSIGKPTPEVAFRIAGPDGELQISSPFGMLGYLDDPALTAASFEDGFFRTGDIAALRPNGCVELIGRSKEIVSRGGNKIAPQEIDHLLGSHPDVAGALSAGVPHPRLGEALYTVVVLRAGSNLTPEALQHWAAERLERFKLPDVIVIEDALPTGSTGKASRALLRERAMAGLANPVGPNPFAA